MNSREIVFWIIKLLVIACSCLALCPEKGQLGPNCWCTLTSYGGSLYCENIMVATDLYAPVKATEKFTMYSMTILNSTLRFFPEDLFEKSSFQKIILYQTQLMSFSDGDLAFKGLEKYLTDIRAQEISYASQWEFNQLRDLKQLEVIDLNYIKMDTIAEDFVEFPKLSMFGLTHGHLTYISDNIFAKCPQLRILSFNQNHLSTLKRSMLPNPAMKLVHLELRNNALKTLPDDFFTAMPALDTVELEGNQISILDEKVFLSPVKSVSFLNLKDNPLHCDCQMLWLPKVKNPLSLLGHCATPAYMKGVTITYILAKLLRCE